MSNETTMLEVSQALERCTSLLRQHDPYAVPHVELALATTGFVWTIIAKSLTLYIGQPGKRGHFPESPAVTVAGCGDTLADAERLWCECLARAVAAKARKGVR